MLVIFSFSGLKQNSWMDIWGDIVNIGSLEQFWAGLVYKRTHYVNFQLRVFILGL